MPTERERERGKTKEMLLHDSRGCVSEGSEK